jgi:hypothetical protein
MRPDAGLCVYIAINNALTIKSAFILSLIDQPTILQVNKSFTAARCSQPLSVAI